MKDHNSILVRLKEKIKHNEIVYLGFLFISDRVITSLFFEYESNPIVSQMGLGIFLLISLPVFWLYIEIYNSVKESNYYIAIICNYLILCLYTVSLIGNLYVVFVNGKV